VSRHFLLDTNIISAAARDPHGRIGLRMREIGQDRLFTSPIVAGELRLGLLNNPQTRVRAQVEELLHTVDIRPLPEAAARYYAQVRHELELRGQPIGGNDLWIAAHALAEDAVIVTDNVREFSRIEGLVCQNWLAVT